MMAQEENCNHDNVMPLKPYKLQQGNSLGYTLCRLKDGFPELFGAVCRKELTANAAAILAGFRKKPTAKETCRKAWAKLSASDREELLQEFAGAA